MHLDHGATTSPVPDHGSLEEEEEVEEPVDPWHQVAADRQEQAGRLDPGEFARFRDFWWQTNASGGRAWRPRRDRDDDEEDEREPGDRGYSGPTPSWDGTTFQDYITTAKLWLATTKTKPRSRGPMLLKNLTGTPSDDLKYLAKDRSGCRIPTVARSS